MKVNIFLFFYFTFIFFSPLSGQQFLNGSFEMADIGCRYALSNGGFNSHIDFVKSIGNNALGGGVGLLTEECGIGPAYDGEYYIGLSISSDHRYRDLVSLELSKALVPDQTYTISYYHKTGNRFSEFNTLEIGLSNSDGLNDFGQLVHQHKGTNKNWEKESFQFVAPFAGKFITVKLLIGNGARIHLDHFVLDCPTALELGNDTSYCVVQDIVLKPIGDFDTYLWQDGTTASTYQVSAPGRYLLKAKRDNCVLTDSIFIEEIEYNCQCQFYVPNAFSPNLDGLNDTFLPQTPCALQSYELKIFGKWGQLIYQSANPSVGWDAKNGFDYFPNGTYAYLLKYQFSYEEEPSLKSGSFLLLH
ncbi:MAG: gliding motility-associated C-terminal domain-containing protein [Saprospiraceae bacterium]